MPALIGGFFRRGHFITVTITKLTQSTQSIAAFLHSTIIYSKTPVNSSTTQGGGKGSGLFSPRISRFISGIFLIYRINCKKGIVYENLQRSLSIHKFDGGGIKEMIDKNVQRLEVSLSTINLKNSICIYGYQKKGIIKKRSINHNTFFNIT